MFFEEYDGGHPRCNDKTPVGEVFEELPGGGSFLQGGE